MPPNPTLSQMAAAVGEAGGHTLTADGLGGFIHTAPEKCPGCHAREEAMKWLKVVDKAGRDEIVALTARLAAAGAEIVERCAKIAEAYTNKHVESWSDTKGRGWFYQSNIRAAWRQAAHKIAAEIRGSLKEEKG